MMNNYTERWNEHVIKGNQLSRELENIEALIEKSKGEDICFTAKPSGATYISVLSPEKMQEFRESVVLAIIKVRDEKTAELEKLMGVRKAATINPEFEAAVKDIVKPPFKADYLTEINGISKYTDEKVEPDPVESKPEYREMTVESVKELYHDKNMTLDQVAKEFGVNRTALYTFITKNNLRKPSKKDIESRGITVPKKSGKERP